MQMFELAVTENIKRRDLNPIEQAEAIHTYQETFGKTSAEAAEFFGVAASTVRGLVRLLNLPEAAREKVRSGEINTGAARSLLVVEKLMGEEGVNEVMERMADDGDGPMEAIKDALRFSSKSVTLDRSDKWVMIDPYPRKHWKPVTKKEIAQVLKEEEQGELEDFNRLASYAAGGMDVTEESFPMFSPEGLEKVQLLMNPLGCMSCPLHAQLDGDHFCGLSLCADRKEEAWFNEETEIVSAETGIPVYDKERDGAFEKLNGYESANVKKFKERHEDLRLMASKGQLYGNHKYILSGEGEEDERHLSDHVQVVIVGKSLEKLQKKAEKEKQDSEQKQVKTKQDPMQDWRYRNKVREVMNEFKARFHWDVTSNIFAPALAGISNVQVLARLCKVGMSLPNRMDDEDEIEKALKSKKDGAATLRRLMVFSVLEDDLDINIEDKKPLTKMAKGMPEQAKLWGVKLPKDLDAQVKKYEDELAEVMVQVREAWDKEGGK